MVKKKVLITGGSGYIGSRLSLYLSQKGFDIIPLCNSKIPDNRDWVQSMHLVLQGDLRNQATLNKIEAVRPDSIIHLVSLDHNQSGINFQETLQVNVQSTWELLSLSSSIGIEKFIYFSTTQVYGTTSESVITEKSMIQPSNAYGLTHKMSEDLVSMYSRLSKLVTISLRLSNSYGESLFENEGSWSLVVNNLCRMAFFEKKIVLNSDGLGLKDFIHYSAITDVVHQLLLLKEVNSGVYNLCSGNSITLLELAFEVQKIYSEIYGIELNIYKNKNQLVKIIDQTKYNNRIENFNLMQMISYDSIPIQEGIKLIFNYLDSKANCYNYNLH